MKFFILLSISLTILYAPRSLSQDLHLTQYYTSNTSLNPALTGSFHGDVRLVANYRSQWRQVSAAIKTSMFSAEKKIHVFPDEIGVGLLLMNDQLTSSYLQNTKAMLSASYEKDLSGHKLRLGLQGGMVYRSFNFGDQTYPGQWNYGSGTFDKTQSSNENPGSNNHLFPNVNAGIAWSKFIGKVKMSASYGLFNVLRPKENFLLESKKLPFRHVGYGALTLNLWAHTSIIPYFLYMRTARATDFLPGVNLRQRINEEVGLLFGGSYRRSQINDDAMIGTLGASYKRFEFGFSMDFNISDLSRYAKNKYAWEISLAYTTPGQISDKVTIPCDRY